MKKIKFWKFLNSENFGSDSGSNFVSSKEVL